MDGPWLVAEYKYREYTTVIKLINLSGIITISEYLIVAIIKKISLIRLILGGAAIFAQQNINHQNDIMGIIDRSPFVSVSLRVMVILYVVFAMQNIADELNPWANIIDILACIPSLDPVIIAANINPMWPTDE